MISSAKRRVTGIILFFTLTSLLLVQCSSIFRSSLPKREGAVIGRVEAPVHIYRDRWGVVHIVAENMGDLIYSQGYVHAQERLFQMDTERRLASGRLSEIYGGDALPIDRFFRSLAFVEKAEEMYLQLAPDLKILVDRYVAGVNDAMKAMKKPPPEARILFYKPEPFTGKDIMLLSLLKGFGLAQWLEELAYYTVLAKAGEKLFRDINPYGKDIYGISILREGTVPRLSKNSLSKLRNILDVVLSFPFFPISGGSNSWVISGSRVDDGKPYLFNDPHLPLTAPSVWFENHLVSPELDVYGFSFPGAPFVIIGFNRYVAWGFTNVMMDDLDLYLEKISSDGTYRHGVKKLNVESKESTIPVRGGTEESLILRKTVHGPIMTPIFSGIDGEFAVRWTGFDATGDHLRSFLLLNSAKSVSDVVKALSYFQFPAQNVVFATADGHIGYVLAGRIPVREKNHPPIPVPGETGKYDWKGYLPFRENPRTIDPPEGFIVTANFPPLPPGSKPYISSVYEPPARGKRIISFLESKEKFSLDELIDLQTDTKMAGAEREVALFLKLLEGTEPKNPLWSEALKQLEKWNGDFSVDSIGATIFEVLYEEVLKNTFGDELGPDGYRIFSRTLRVPVLSLTRLMFDKPDSRWFDDVNTRDRRETIEDVVKKSFAETIDFLREKFGDDLSSWKWGELHRVVMRHPFGKKWYFRKFFNIGPAKAPGSGRTVWKMEFAHGSDFTAAVGPSFRLVVSPAQADRARVVITTGQSGYYFEEHYRDQFPLWLKGEYRNVTLDIDERSNFTNHLAIVPSMEKAGPSRGK